MTFRDTHIHTIVLVITGLVALTSRLEPRWMESAQYVLLAVGTILIGIPHGATDNHVYQHAVQRSGIVSMPRFYIVYLVIAVAYGVFWLVAPTVSLAVFLLISVYHFGQSNLFYTALPEGAGRKKALYITWGAFNLASPLLFRYDQAAPVINYLLGYDPIPVTTALTVAPLVSGALLVMNVAILTVLLHRRVLSGADYWKEVAGFVVLLALYTTAPLYVSFIVYWAFWHSVNSAIEIADTWPEPHAMARVVRFYRAALPLTVITFGGIAAVFWLAEAYGSPSALIGVFFVIIAALTLPHTVVMELLYRDKAQPT
ncbi:MAG: Brp/Blh family beta-carotene 15,15'-dioxygenase [Spirochaetaceae bacterium]